MDHFNYINDQLFAEEVAITDIISEHHTPCYIYSKATITRHITVFREALGQQPHEICYAVKANSNLAILNLLAKLNVGFDIVSQGELARVLQAGGNADKIVFSGVGKTEDEIAFALKNKIHCFNVESEEELLRIKTIANYLQLQAPISLRINPDVDAKTHPHISTGLKENKFGIAKDKAIAIYQKIAPDNTFKILGLACHIGSQITELTPFEKTIDQLIKLYQQLNAEGINLSHLDVGGGLGVCYHNESPPTPHQYVSAIVNRLPHKNIKLMFEPGRVIMANAGIFVCQVEYIKQSPFKRFVIVDGAMNDLIRPALYNAWQQIIPVVNDPNLTEETVDIVGPVCETADYLGKNRQLAVKQGDLIAIKGAGAYGFSMSSNYNSRPRAAEVLVDGNKFHLIRQRENIADLYAGEKIVD